MAKMALPISAGHSSDHTMGRSGLGLLLAAIAATAIMVVGLWRIVLLSLAAFFTATALFLYSRVGRLRRRSKE